MNNKSWIEANLEGKVKARALRACDEQPDEQPDWVNNYVDSIVNCFYWPETKEGSDYWNAICSEYPNPDQYLPANYIDVDHFVEPTEMVEDEFLEWLEEEMLDCLSCQNNWTHEVLRRVMSKYNELNNK
jgi:hypothetical protein